MSGELIDSERLYLSAVRRAKIREAVHFACYSIQREINQAANVSGIFVIRDLGVAVELFDH
jgi:hypothetical protein